MGVESGKNRRVVCRFFCAKIFDHRIDTRAADIVLPALFPSTVKHRLWCQERVSIGMKIEL